MHHDYERCKLEGKLKEGYMKDGPLQIEFMKLDLSSLQSTMDFIQAYKASGRSLHVLLCNAGIALLNRGIHSLNCYAAFNNRSVSILIVNLLQE